METVTWVGVAMAGIALLGTVVNVVDSVISKRTARAMERDKLDHETRLVTLEVQHKQCMDDAAAVRVLLQDCEARDKARDEREKQAAEERNKLFDYIRITAQSVKETNKEVAGIKQSVADNNNRPTV